MFGRPTFGTQPTSFGFGTSVPNSTTFGQSNQLFGNAQGGFGTPTTGFGAPTQPMFGSPQQTSAPLFGSTNTSTFGQPNQSGFGSTLFGNAAQPSSSGIFGTSSASTFGQQQNKPTGFGFGSSTTSGGLFSQNSQQPPQNAPSVFQNSAAGGMFGNTNTFGQNSNQMGTVVKFVPVTGTDSIQKSGIVQSINTKHYCITCMKDYESKSLEELRLEDYQCNRKGPQQQAGFGAAQPFGITSTSSSIFGQPDNKATFGTPRTDFGTQNAFGMNTQTTTQNAFAKPSTGFGTTSTNSFGFGTNTSSTGLFGSNNTAKPFAAPTAQLFQPPQQQQAGFGQSVFGQANPQNNGGMFGKPAANGAFNAPQTGFSFPQQNQNNLFQTSKPNTGFGVFGQTTTQTNTFGQQQAQPSFGGFGNNFKPAQPTFGTNTQPTFGNQQNNLFGNTQNKPLFGNTSGGNLFNNNSFQQNTSFQFPTQQQQQQQQPVMLQSLDLISQDLRSLVQITDPYGYNKHLEGLSPIKPSNAAYVTNPKDLQKLLESPPPMAIVSPMNKRLKVLPISAKKTNLFDEMLDKETSEINFSLRTSAKRLVLQKELRIRAEEDNENEELTSHSEIVESIDKQQKIQSTPSVPRLNLSSPFQENYSSGSPALQKDSLTSLITINSNLSKGDASSAGDSSTMGSQFFGDLTHQESIPRDRGDEPPPEAPKIDTCGVTLTRPEYFTVPPLEKLIEHKNGDGKCLVKGFTIGRVGYGNVCFPDPMDVANLNLDELVHFRYREVTIYPDDTKKPPVGQGLNRRAQVTLDRVFPKAKIDRKLITDAETLMAINFSDTLRDLCEKHSTKFLDYRPETGSWVFMVEHFSKYGFSDSDDEESTAQLVQKQKLLEQKVKDEHERRVMEEHKRKKQQKMIMGRKFLAEDLFADEDLQKGDYLTRNGPILSQRLMPEDLLLDDDMTIEENSLCTLGASIETLDFDFDSIPPTHAMHHIQARRNLYQNGNDILLMKAQMYNGQKFEPIQIKNTKLQPIPPKAMKDLPNRAPPPPPKKHAYHQVKVKPKKFKVQNATYAINIDKSLYKNRNYMDIATFKGRSFKVGWGRGMFLTTKISPKVSTPVQLMEASSQSSISAIGVIDASPFMDFEPFKDRLEKHLQVVLDTADVVMQATNIPFLKPRPGRTALLRHQLMARETARDNLGNEQVNYYQQIWNLCAACWGPMSKPTNRRDLLSTWLEKAVEQTVEEELVQIEEDDAGEVYKKIFTYLTGHYITEAANFAADEDLHNLSLLISQLNASQNAKGIMQQQLEQWRTSLVYDHVQPIIQKLYMLIAGQTVGAGSNEIDPFINVCQDLDWLRCFAIMLWYIAPSTSTIAKGLDLYREAFETDGYSARPSPQYANRQDVYDLQYHLMLLHIGRGKPLETALHPETHAKRPTDFRLSWLLLQTLQALDVGIISSAAKTVLTTSFSQQLENYGLYKWAVFVLLFLEDPYLRKEYIMGVLHRNLPGGEDHRMIEDELVTEFCLPAEWLHEVKAYKTTFLGMPWESYKHFTFMEDWVTSHDIAITDVVPQLLVNEQFDLVSYILRDIEPGCRSIITWPEEGGLMLMFLDMYDKFQEKRRFSREEAMSIHSLLLKICTGVTNYPFRSVMQRAAIAEISKHCSIYSRILLDQMQAAHKGITNTTTAQVEELTMPPDYRIDDMYTEMNDFYQEPVQTSSI